MNELFFWKGWKKPHQSIYFFLLGLFVISAVLLAYAMATGFDAVAEWQVFSELEPVQVPVDNFTHNLISFSVDIENYLVKQKYAASEIKVIPWHGYVWLVLVCLSFSAFLAVVSRLEIFWMGLGMATFLFFIGTAGIDVLEVFGLKDKTFVIILLAAFLLLVIWIYYFAKGLGLFERMLIFAGFMAVAAGVIAAGSNEPTPFLYISRFGIIVPLVISALFMAIIGYDLIYMFLYLVTASKSVSAKNNLLQFIVICILYFGNLILILARKMDMIDWDILYLDAFLIFMLSAIAGVWVFKKKIARNANVLPFRPYGAVFYMALAVISLSTISYAFITGNDALTEMLEDVILYTHICFGIVFFFYIIINFSDLFKKNVRVHEIAFSPRRMPLFMVTGVALVAILALFTFRKFSSLKRARAGYYVLAGDAFFYNDKTRLAKEYYKLSTEYGYQNHRGNYSLASVSERLGEVQNAQRFYTNATSRNPSPYSYVNLANIYVDAEMFFPALLQLRDAAGIFPENPQIHNNLAVLYGQTAMLDSSYYYFTNAIANSDERVVPVTNLIAILSQKGFEAESDSVAESYNFIDSEAFYANEAATKNLLNKPYQREFSGKILADSALTHEELAYLVNVATNKIREENKDLRTTLKAIENEDVVGQIDLLEVLNKWYTGDKHQAALDFRTLIYQSSSSAQKYSRIYGMLVMKHKGYRPALPILKESVNSFSTADDRLPYAVALLENEQFDDAREQLRIIEVAGTGDAKRTAHELRSAVETLPDSAVNLPESRRYLFLHFRKADLSEKERQYLLSSFENEELQVLATADLMDFHLEKDQPEKARALFDSLSLNGNVGQYFIGELDLQYLYLLLEEGQWGKLKEAVQDIYLNPYASSHLTYMQAKIREQEGDSTGARKNYLAVVNENPFNEKFAVDAVEFLNKIGEPDEAYRIISEAVELQPKNPELLQVYAKQNLRVNLLGFAEQTAEDLRHYLNEQKYRQFMRSFESLKDSLNQN